jgi:hypothetical protein
MPLPYDGVMREENCYGLEMNGGLMSQCWSSKLNGDVYCKRCRTQASKNESGKPSVGDIRDRIKVSALEYKHPKTGRQVVPYINVMKKKNITLEEAEEEAKKYGVNIEAEQLEEREQKRGRPATKKEVAEKKKQGRKRAEKVIVSAGVEDDLIAALKKAQEEGEVVKAEKVEAVVVEGEKAVVVEGEKKRGRKPMTEEEKKAKAEERKLAKKAELEAKAKAEEETKANKAELEAKAKAEEEAKGELESESGIESGVEEESCGGSEEEKEVVRVRKFEHKGVTYLRTSENVLYDVESQEQVGMWNEEKQEIEEIDEEDESDDEEEE